ncbi:MAG: glycosyltransferase [Flavobacteriales bacterium]|nr:glycosyltransferase [Flavobacteriales bacterium]
MDLRISVIIPVYNAARFIEGTVRSVLAFPEVREVVLVEDGSPDDSLAACQALVGTDPRIRLIRHADGGNHGAGASRNLGFRMSTCPYVVFLDADDRFLPNRFDRERELFAQHPDADGVYGATGVEYHDADARERFLTQFPTDELSTVREVVPPERLLHGLLGGNGGFGYFCNDALTVKRSAVERLGEPFPEHLRLHQDTSFTLRIAHGARLYAGEVRRPVVVRGVHVANRVTANTDKRATQDLLYRHLDAWARSVPMDRADRRLIRTRRLYWGILNAKGRTALVGYGLWMLVQPWVLRRVRVREAWIDRLFGEGSRMAGLLRRLSWRLFRNDLRPV